MINAISAKEKMDLYASNTAQLALLFCKINEER
jgi:hypothetical protein